MTPPVSHGEPEELPQAHGRAVVRMKPKAEARAIRHGFPWVYADELVTDRRTQGLTPAPWRFWKMASAGRLAL